MHDGASQSKRWHLPLHIEVLFSVHADDAAAVSTERNVFGLVRSEVHVTALRWTFAIYAVLGASHAAYAYYIVERAITRLHSHPPHCPCCGDILRPPPRPRWKTALRLLLAALLWPLSIAYGIGHVHGRASVGGSAVIRYEDMRP